MHEPNPRAALTWRPLTSLVPYSSSHQTVGLDPRPAACLTSASSWTLLNGASFLNSRDSSGVLQSTSPSESRIAGLCNIDSEATDRPRASALSLLSWNSQCSTLVSCLLSGPRRIGRSVYTSATAPTFDRCFH